MCVRYSVFLRKGKGFWEGKSLKIVVKQGNCLFSRDCKIKLNCIFATLKINKSIWYVCRDSRATIQSKQRPKGLRSPFDK
jgi:hypothetical protein